MCACLCHIRLFTVADFFSSSISLSVRLTSIGFGFLFFPVAFVRDFSYSQLFSFFILCVLSHILRIYTHHITICPIESSLCRCAVFLFLPVLAHSAQLKAMRIEDHGEKEQEKNEPNDILYVALSFLCYIHRVSMGFFVCTVSIHCLRYFSCECICVK